MKARNVTEDEYLSLLNEIRKHDRAYFLDANPLISDYEYDQLINQAIEIEKTHPDWISPSSPTQRVGESPTKGFVQAAHRVPMLSLANTYSKEELSKLRQAGSQVDREDAYSFCAQSSKWMGLL